MPTKNGTGASNISINGWGKIGTNAKHHLKGYSNELNPRIAWESKFYLPTNTTYFSSKIAPSNFRKSFREYNENNEGQNQ